MTMRINNVRLADQLQKMGDACSIFDRRGVLLAIGSVDGPAPLNEIHRRLGGIRGDLHGRSKVALVLNGLVQDRLVTADHNCHYTVSPKGQPLLVKLRESLGVTA